jgi:hypothetical protein
MSQQLARERGHEKTSMVSVTPVLPVRSSAIVINKAALPRRSRIASILKREIAPLAIVTVLLLSVTSLGWLVLRSLSVGTGGMEVRLNWTAIVVLGMPLVGLAFLLVSLFIRVAFWQTPHTDTGSQINPSTPVLRSQVTPAVLRFSPRANSFGKKS